MAPQVLPFQESQLMLCRLRSETTELFLSHFSSGWRHRCHPLRNPLCNFLSETKAARSPSEVVQNTCVKCSSIWASSMWNRCQLSQGVPEGEAVLSEHGWSIYFRTEIPSELLRWRPWFLAGKCQIVGIRHACGCRKEKGEVKWQARAMTSGRVKVWAKFSPHSPSCQACYLLLWAHHLSFHGATWLWHQNSLWCW